MEEEIVVTKNTRGSRTGILTVHLGDTMYLEFRDKCEKSQVTMADVTRALVKKFNEGKIKLRYKVLDI